MTYLQAFVFFMGGITVSRTFINMGPIFRLVCPDAAVWAEIVYALRIVSIMQLLFCLFGTWNTELAIISSATLLVMLRGATVVPTGMTAKTITHLNQIRAISGLLVYGGGALITLL